MKITCISDLHGELPELPGGDLLIVAGDLTASDKLSQYLQFFMWMSQQDYKFKVLIGGNHDNEIQNRAVQFDPNFGITYLCDSGCEFEGLKIWGSPWTSQFPGINPHCCAFTMPFGCDTEDHLDDKWQMIPNDTDILITHSPPYGIFDETDREESVGSRSLIVRLAEIKPKLHVFGHIHEEGGKILHVPWSTTGTTFVNASLMDSDYDMTNKPVEIEL